MLKQPERAATRMTDERLAEAIERVRTIALPGLLRAPDPKGVSRGDITNAAMLAADLRLIVDEIDRLRFLAAVRAPTDSEVEDLIGFLVGQADGHPMTDDYVAIIRRLTASLSSAERERDEARAAFDDASKVAAKMSVEMNAAIAERDEARAALSGLLMPRRPNR